MSLSIIVPGSSANLGPGFDVLGLAVSTHVRMGLGGGDEPVMARHPARVAFEAAGGDGEAWFASSLPSGRGLGFSGASIVAGTTLALAQREGIDTVDLDRFIAASRDEILRRATEIEGHPDNVAASLFGGVVAVANDRVVRLPIGFDARLVAWIPRDTTSTSKSRSVLPASYERDEVVFNLGRIALLIEGLRTGDLESLSMGVEDRLHQDRRLAVAPMSLRALETLRELGARAVWLSGSGPTVMALCDAADADSLCDRATASLDELEGRVTTMAIDEGGARQAT
jgi:homoserine kinase